MLLTFHRYACGSLWSLIKLRLWGVMWGIDENYYVIVWEVSYRNDFSRSDMSHSRSMRSSAPPPTALPGTSTYVLTHWGRMTCICIRKLTIIGSDYLAQCWNIGDFYLANIFIQEWIHLKLSSHNWRPFCLGLNVIPTQDALPWIAITTRRFISCLYVDTSGLFY